MSRPADPDLIFEQLTNLVANCTLAEAVRRYSRLTLLLMEIAQNDKAVLAAIGAAAGPTQAGKIECLPSLRGQGDGDIQTSEPG